MKATAFMVVIGTVLAAMTGSASVFYGKASGTGGSLQQTITWYSNEACTDTSGVMSPYAAGASAHQYVIIGSSKVQANSSFPDVTAYCGTDGSTVGTSVAARHEWNMNGGLTLTFPNVTVFSSYFRVNSTGMSKFLGSYSLVKTSQSIEFGGINIQNDETRGAELAGAFSSASEVTVLLSGTIASKTVGISAIKVSGDFSSFKGSFVCMDPVFLQYARGDKKLNLDLTSVSAMGDTSYARTDAYTLANDTHLTMSPAVVQSSARGITLSLSAGQKVYLNADTDWTLTTPLYGGSAGALVKEGSGKLTMDCSTELGNIVVASGTLELGTNFTFASGATVTVKSGATLRTYSTDGLNIVLENGAVHEMAHPVVYATDPDQSNKNILTETVSRMDGDAEVFLWSDHLKAHGGADYVLGNGAYVASWTGWEDRRVFPGESLEISGGSRLMLRTKQMYFTNLVMRGGTRMTTAGCGWNATPHQIQGKLKILDPSSSVEFVANYDYSVAPGRQTTYNIEADVTGDGWLNFGGQAQADYIVTSTNSSFTGRMSIGATASSDRPAAVQFSHPAAFGGPLSSFNYQGFAVRSAHSGIKPMTSMTYAIANRGLVFEEASGFIDTPEGVEFVFMNDIVSKKGFVKRGTGTLSLGGTAKFSSSFSLTGNGTNNRLGVEEGYLKAINTNSYANLVLTFAAGAGIAVDAVPSNPDVAAFGLFAPEAGMFVANGTVKVRLDGAETQIANGVAIRVHVCTVSAGAADLSNVLVGMRPKGYACKIEKETLANGLVRYSAVFERQGLTIMVR